MIILLLLLGKNRCSQAPEIPVDSTATGGTRMSKADSLAMLDSLAKLNELAKQRLDSLRRNSLRLDSLKRADSLAKFLADSLFNHLNDSIKKYKDDSTKNANSKKSGLKNNGTLDSLKLLKEKEALLKKMKEDSLRIADSLKSLKTDTIPPYVYLDPPAGLYEKSVTVSILSDEKGVTKYFKDSKKGGDFVKYTGAFTLKDSTKITFFGLDSVNNSSDTIFGEYHISAETNPCPKGMVYIKNKKVCIDTFEWPNKRGKIPSSFVSMYAAIDSCSSVDKRLCTEDEWKEAAGASKNKYPYGKSYSRRKCNTESQKRSASGKYKECRSYYGAYDMTGNVSEWTSTEDKNNAGLYRVYGGSFSSTSTATTKSYKFSYFPENKYVGVGFRCCLSK